MVGRVYEREVASYPMHGLVEGVDAHRIRLRWFRFETFLHARGKSQIFFDFHLALLQFQISGAEFLVGGNLLGDVCECDDPKPAAGILERSRADDDRQTTAALPGQNKGITVVSVAKRDLNLPPQEIQFLRGIEAVESHQLFGGETGHLYQPGVHEENTMAVACDDDAVIEEFEHRLHLGEPLRLFQIDARSWTCHEQAITRPAKAGRTRVIDLDGRVKEDLPILSF